MRRQRSIFLNIILLVVLMTASLGVAQAQQPGPELAIHYVDGKPQAEDYSYLVDVYFSAYRAGGDAVRDLSLEEIIIREDGRRVEILGFELAKNVPMSLALAIDTSGSMSGARIRDVIGAMSEFSSSLGNDSLAAVLTFDSKARTEIGFTDNLLDVRRKLESVETATGAATCFYDVLYEAVSLTKNIPSGRRAVVIVTDGPDTLPDGQPCSKYDERDVIEFALEGQVHVPIYTIGLGDQVNPAGLKKISDATGGRAHLIGSGTSLQNDIESILELVRAPYRATYVSNAAAGQHEIEIEATVSKQQVLKSRQFFLPNFSHGLRILSPQDGESLSGRTSLSVQHFGDSSEVARVEFFVDGSSVGQITTSPYQLDWDVPENRSGTVSLEAAAYTTDEYELARASIQVVLNPLPVAPTEVAPTPDEVTTHPEVGDGGDSVSFWLILLGGLGLTGLVAAGIAGLFFAKRKKHREQERDRLWQEKVQGLGSPESSFTGGEERTMDAFYASESAYGILLVLHSDDSTMTGQRFELTKPTTSLGRKADNDIIFPKDTPVSRYHAEIEASDGSLHLREVIAQEDGNAKRPAYGTFINEIQMEGRVHLRNGDEIRLGKRTRLRLELREQIVAGDDATIDEFLPMNDKTIDSWDGPIDTPSAFQPKAAGRSAPVLEDFRRENNSIDEGTLVDDFEQENFNAGLDEGTVIVDNSPGYNKSEENTAVDGLGFTLPPVQDETMVDEDEHTATSNIVQDDDHTVVDDDDDKTYTS